MLESAITSRGQTTLPKPVRQALGVKSGDRVRYIIPDNEVRILPIRSYRLRIVSIHENSGAGGLDKALKFR